MFRIWLASLIVWVVFRESSSFGFKSIMNTVTNNVFGGNSDTLKAIGYVLKNGEFLAAATFIDPARAVSYDKDLRDKNKLNAKNYRMVTKCDQIVEKTTPKSEAVEKVKPVEEISDGYVIVIFLKNQVTGIETVSLGLENFIRQGESDIDVTFYGYDADKKRTYQALQEANFGKGLISKIILSTFEDTKDLDYYIGGCLIHNNILVAVLIKCEELNAGWNQEIKLVFSPVYEESINKVISG